MEPLILFIILFSFLCSFLILPIWIRKCRQVGLLWSDMNKFKNPKNVAASGGVVVVLSFIIGVLFYIAIRTFVFKDAGEVSLSIFALLSVILILSLIGLVDDLLGWKHGGLSARTRIILSFLSAIPLVVINAGYSSISLPFFGVVNLGLWYPLFLIPLGVAGCTTTYNFLAGFNGLESSQGIIILSALAWVTYVTGNAWLSIIALCMVASLCAFWLFNRVPAKVFPGDIMTYSIGALIAIIAILGNIEKIAVFFFIPYIIEVVLKSRGKLKKYSFGKPQKDRSLELPYEKIYGLEHLAIYILKKIKPSKKAYEKDVVYLINGFQILIIILGLLFVL